MQNEYHKSFNNNLKKIVDNNSNEKDQTITKDFDLLISKYSNIHQGNQKNIANNLYDFYEDILEIKDKLGEMSSALYELKSIKSKELILKKKKSKENEKINIYEYMNPNPRNDIFEDDENENDLYITFVEKSIEKIIDIKDSKFFYIDNIRIINEGKKSCKNLRFIKDKEKSSENIYFYSNSKKINEYALGDEIEPGKSLNCSICLGISNANPGSINKIIVYVEQNNNNIISDPFEIIIKINKTGKMK